MVAVAMVVATTIRFGLEVCTMLQFQRCRIAGDCLMEGQALR